MMIRDKLELSSIWTLSHAVNLARKVETQVSRLYRTSASRKPIWDKNGAPFNPPEQGKYNSGKATISDAGFNHSTASSSATKVPSKSPIINSNQVRDNPYVKPSTIKCFRCLQPEHKSNECTTRKKISDIGTG